MGAACRVMPIYEQYESYCLERRMNELSKIHRLKRKMRQTIWKIYNKNYILSNGIVDESCKPYTAVENKNQCKPDCYTCMAKSQNKCSEIGQTTFTNFECNRCCKVDNPLLYKITGFSNISNRFKSESNDTTTNWHSEDLITYIKTEIYTYGPVTIAIDAIPIETYNSTDVFKKTDNKYELNHLVAIIGWGEYDNGKTYWIIRNSWGTFWCTNGYIKIDAQSIGLSDKENDVFAAYPT